LRERVEIRGLLEIPVDADFGHARAIVDGVGRCHHDHRSGGALRVLAKLTENRRAVDLRKIQIQQQHVRTRRAAGLPYTRQKG
jgi:hypothetical protein